jgi:hypothetical protein
MQFTIWKINSNVVKGISYNKNRNLTVQLLNKVYVYKNVPRKLAVEFLNADSKGKFFNSFIKNEFKLKF